MKLSKVQKALTTMPVVAAIAAQNMVFADVIQDYSGDKGEIGSSSIFTGLYKLIANVAGTLQWVIPIAGVCWLLYYVFRIMTGDEQDQQRYKKGITKVLICVVIAEMAVVLINLIAGYFGE